jgi:hypothetical protein
MMPHLFMTMLVAAMMAGSTALGHAQEGTIDKAAADAFDTRLFAAAPGKKAYRAALRRGPSGTASEAEGLCHAALGDGRNGAGRQ